ncbi:WecB/TagA/CpsF family glycosyltransferase [soil metagenome]
MGILMDKPRVTILGVSIHSVDFQATLTQIAGWIKLAEPSSSICRQICTVNPEFIIDAWRAPKFAAVLQRADLRVPDGIGVLWATRLLGTPLQERVTGSDGIYRICERAAHEQWRVYLLGAAPGVAEKTASILQKRYPGLQIVGAYSGSPSVADWPIIAESLRATQPDILFVAFGHPRQDFWIDAHRHQLPAKVAIGVGGAFDFVAGVTVRAPRWMQRLGLEWLHRLLREPWRWRRMLKLPVFVGLVLVQWLSKRSGNAISPPNPSS